LAKRRQIAESLDQYPLFEVPSEWSAPTGPLPDLRGREPVSVDLETRDGGLARGAAPGWVYDDGHISGVAVARGSVSSYYPVRHEGTEGLRDPEALAAWLSELFRSDTPIVFQNAPYDLGWLSTWGVPCPHVLDDTHAMAVMIDENRMTYDLDSLCEWQGLPGKDETLLREVCANYGWHTTKTVKSNMWRLPAKYVGPYAEVDALSTLALAQRLRPLLAAEGLEKAYRTEMGLIPMVLEMRRRGIRIDEARAERTASQLDAQRDEILTDIRHKLAKPGLTMDWLRSPDKLASVFNDLQLKYPMTPKSDKASFESEWLEAQDHWFPQAVARVRSIEDMSGKFIRNYIMSSAHMGRVHAEVHQLRDDTGGTRSYRFSYSDPPVQQIPARDPVLAPLIRGLFLPEKDELWGAHDYSQQEPRLAVHFAAVCSTTGYQAAVDYYTRDPGADFHQMVADLTGLSRKQAKIINLALMYGMGLPKLARSLKVTLEQAKEIMDQYNERMPFVSGLADFCMRRADHRGYIKLLDGARCRWDMWDCSYLSKTERDEGYAKHLPMGSCGRTEAERRLADDQHPWHHKRLKRAHTHKAMNRLIQGSAARQTKMAMLECWREGLVPLLQMHDELDFSHSTEAQALRVKQIMLDVCPLRVPMKVDSQFGRTWGQASEEPPKGTAPASWSDVWAMAA
jgi:DNA polymerase I-like protein with 3'-5' exonuclease and polymerase domains